MIEPGLLILCCVFFVSNAVEAVTGFGGTIIAVTIGAHFFPISTLVPAIVPVNMVLSVYIAARHHRHVDKKLLFKTIAPVALCGLAVGAAGFQLLADNGRLKLGYGAFVLCFAAVELTKMALAKGEEKPRPLGRGAAAAWIATGGLMQGLYASGGPMMVYYASRNLGDKSRFRSMLSSIWIVLNVVLISTHVATGKANMETLKISAALVPSLLLGIAAGEAIHRRISERAFRLAVFSLLAVAGSSLLAKSF